tara:strand:- start:335 stop:1012 length:678 start_codon:yes stop_codon:yes gene_type:complete
MAKYLVIIPARAGSKGIRFKNLLEIEGRSLIGHAITAALETELDVDVVISSENDLLLKEGVKFGARALKRPKYLATDTATTISVVEHVLSDVEYTPELVIVLQPTSPLRRSTHVYEAISIAEESDCDSVVSVCEINNEILKSYCLDDNGYAIGVHSAEAPFMPRQNLPKTYKANGAIFITKPLVIQADKRLHGDKLIPYIMCQESSLDIDGEDDLAGLNYKLFLG